MAGKEQFAGCSREEYEEARAKRLAAHQLRLGHNRLTFYLESTDDNEWIKGPVYATRERLGGLSVIIALLDQDLDATDKIFFGFMPGGIWNTQPGYPGIYFQREERKFETHNGLLLPYSDGFEDVKFLHAHTSTSPRLSRDALPPPFLAT